MLLKLTTSVFLGISLCLTVPVSALTYRVCETDDPGGCAPHENNTPCGTIASWATSTGACKGGVQSLVKTSDSSGGQCGHAVFVVTCN